MDDLIQFASASAACRLRDRDADTDTEAGKCAQNTSDNI